MEFHISRTAREKYKFSETMFAFDGNVIFANNLAVREFTRQMNERIDLSVFPEKAVLASHIYAMGLIDEVFHYIIQLYHEQINPAVLESLFQSLDEKLTKPVLENALNQFCDEFPPSEVYSQKWNVEEYLVNTTHNRQNRLIVLEEILLLWLSNINPAYMQYGELFDDSNLAHKSAYSKLIAHAKDFFMQQPDFGSENTDLLNLLHKPAEVSPYSLSGQLEYIRKNWGHLLGNLLTKLLGSIDMIREESKLVFSGPGPAQIPDYAAIRRLVDLDIERFSPDRDWMPSLVLIAKNAYVWMDQLTKKYNRTISNLSDIPDEELDFLAGAGFTGLWLIGLWQRSQASERIKKLCGNPEAVASAYSIDSYRIADDLGGETAFQNLRERAWRRGIRLASDMVPNHMGIDSDWVIHHPEFFLSLDYCPFPSYSFNGENLSPDPSVGIHLEDHYFSRSDASVVFKRTDYQSGSEKYIYHGNDGTVMPWNDTAQLNYLEQNVREAVIQIILDVARRTPIIRFDAAMTLAKKHIQRLWFPEPGSGGAIPTRSEHGLSKADFDRMVPEEFWRNVVDRVASEVPDTLLLAEAFWLMEGYFVRTLGMHRVYNSAFMHMLRNEDNANFRKLIKNTIEFDPDILKRYVNFMNNPDEKTAVDQFGSGDKYFGVCTIMSTLPGLPMFGHGQLEGYSEKYGMEYRRAYLDEKINQDLLNHHQKVIFPILQKRSNYSEVVNFRLYDFFLEDGSVDENVYAYSNLGNSEKSLVLVNNKFSNSNGWIKTTAPFLQKRAGNNEIVTENITDALHFSNNPDQYLIFKDRISNLMFIRNSSEVSQQGFSFDLHAYDYRVYEGFYEVKEESDTHFREICAQLAGRGVPDIFLEIRRLQILPLYSVLEKFLTPETLGHLVDLLMNSNHKIIHNFITNMQLELQDLYHAIKKLDPDMLSWQEFNFELEENIKNTTKILSTLGQSFGQHNTLSNELSNTIFSTYSNTDNITTFWLWTIFRSFHKNSKVDDSAIFAMFFYDLMLDEFVNQHNTTNTNRQMDKDLMRVLFLHAPDLGLLTLTPSDFLHKNMQDMAIHLTLGVNRSNDVLWFNQEAMEKWLKLHLYQVILMVYDLDTLDAGSKLEAAIKAQALTRKILESIPKSEFKLEKLISILA